MAKLKESYCYFDDTEQRRGFCVRMGIKATLPAWLPQRLISRTLFGKQGDVTVRRCEKHYGFFLWAPEFSNVHTTFAYEESPITVDGTQYACSEAYFQSMKSLGQPGHEESHESIRILDPDQAFRMGQACRLRPDWEKAKRSVMARALRAKFTSNDRLQELLCSTEKSPLLQIKPGDAYWGTGPRSDGQNMLGQLLQELRATL